MNRDSTFRENVMGWIEQQATEAWAPEDGAKAEAAVDFLMVRIKPMDTSTPSHPGAGRQAPRNQWTQMDQPSSSTTGQSPGQPLGHGRRHERYADGPPTPSAENAPQKRQRTERQFQKQREDVGG